MPDLDALSREVADAGDEWMMPGARMLLDGKRAVRIVMPGRIWVEETGQHIGYEPFAGDIPDLRDPVTVNSLLGNGEVQHVDDCEWVACCGHIYTGRADDRTTAICRAWIAARGKK